MKISDISPFDIKQSVVSMQIVRARAMELIIEANSKAYTGKGKDAQDAMLNLEATIACLEAFLSAHEDEHYLAIVKPIKENIEYYISKGVMDGTERRPLQLELIRWLKMISKYLLPNEGFIEANQITSRVGFYEDLRMVNAENNPVVK